ncbi:hypothetical protein LTR66_014629 [Elasticomyces elasticus]|nr:hypothetical protein LTR66_014629 [Elasticomyces elasticus]
MEGYDPRKHRTYPRPNKGDKDQDGDGDGDHDDSSTEQSTPRRSTAEEVAAVVQPSLRTTDPNKPQLLSDLPAHASSYNNESGVSQGKDQSVLEFLSWGRGNLSDYQVKSFDLLREPWKNNAHCPEQEVSNGFMNNNHVQLSFLQMLIPRRDQVFSLVDYHVSSVLWYHTTFHGPTFRHELQYLYSRPEGLQIKDADLRWIALLFSTMAGSMACASDQKATSWGFAKQEKIKLTRQWYKATLACLNLGDFMWRHHINSIQAICGLTMSGHILGFSNTQSTLLGSALNIAQGLGLQRLGADADGGDADIGTDLPVSQREKIIRREIGRRVWAQICNQDWFSIPFSEMYSIQKKHFQSLTPQHIEDRNLQLVPQHEPSAVTFSTMINKVASLMPQVHDALAESSTPFTQYEQVLLYDAKMRKLASDGLDQILNEREPIKSDWPKWLPWARQSIKICIAHKTIMIHRRFLGKSLTDTTFDYTRKTCMTCSRTILEEAQKAFDEPEHPRLWIDQAFMVAAGITLSLDIFHRNMTDPEFEQHRKLVESAIHMLSRFEDSMIAIRGVRLLTSLLAEQARLAAAHHMEQYNRKRAREGTDDQTSPESVTHSSSFMNVGSGTFSNAMKRQKFDVPKFMESFVGDGSFTKALGTALRNDDGTPVASSIYNNAMSGITGNQPPGFVQEGYGSSLAARRQRPDAQNVMQSSGMPVYSPQPQGDVPPATVSNDFGIEAFE